METNNVLDLVRTTAAGAMPGTPETLEILLRTPLELSVRLGSTRMPLRDVLALEEDSLVELDQAADGAVEVLVNNSVIVTGEVVSVDGGYGIRILEVAGGPGPAALIPEADHPGGAV